MELYTTLFCPDCGKISDGHVVRLSDLPKIETAVEERLREALKKALLGDGGVFAWPSEGTALTMNKESLASGLDCAFAALKPDGAEEKCSDV